VHFMQGANQSSDLDPTRWISVQDTVEKYRNATRAFSASRKRVLIKPAASERFCLIDKPK